ncbi:MAG: GNAT family N-acetyltransferase [Alphaproteobacteria bacterium]
MSAAEFAIRPAQASDAEAAAACVAAAYTIYLPRIGKPPGPMLDDYAEVIDRHPTFVLACAAEIAGVLVLVRNQSGLLLDNVAVHPDHQGQGFGQRLIAFAEAEARRLSYRALDLYTHELMIENVGLYRALGYEETGRRTVRGYPRIYMRKRL